MSRLPIQIRIKVSSMLDAFGMRILALWKPILLHALGGSTETAQDMWKRMSPGSTVLFLSPHPDDEFFGCPALMLMLSDHGCKVTLLTATDGEGFTATGYGDRVEESRRVAESKHWSHVALHLPDGNLGSNASELDTSIRKAIADSHGQHFDMIAAPIWCDYHRDHRALALSLLRVARTLPPETRPNTLAFYYTMSFPTRVPSVLHPLVLDGKEWLEMIASWRCAYSCSMSESAVQLWMASRRVIGDTIGQPFYGEVVLFAPTDDVELLCEAALNGEADAANIARGRFALTNLPCGIASVMARALCRGKW